MRASGLASLLLACTLMLSACGGEDSSAAVQQRAGATTVAATPAAAEPQSPDAPGAAPLKLGRDELFRVRYSGSLDGSYSGSEKATYVHFPSTGVPDVRNLRMQQHKKIDSGVRDVWVQFRTDIQPGTYPIDGIEGVISGALPTPENPLVLTNVSLSPYKEYRLPRKNFTTLGSVTLRSTGERLAGDLDVELTGKGKRVRIIAVFDAPLEPERQK